MRGDTGTQNVEAETKLGPVSSGSRDVSGLVTREWPAPPGGQVPRRWEGSHFLMGLQGTRKDTQHVANGNSRVSLCAFEITVYAVRLPQSL